MRVYIDANILKACVDTYINQESSKSDSFALKK